MDDERIVHLDRLTSREVGEWLKTDAPVFVCHGPVSGHRPWTTLGMHAHAAEAVSVLLARRSGALVYPLVPTAFAGAARLYPGTVPFSYAKTLRSRGTRGFRYDAEREHSAHGTVGLTWRGRDDVEPGRAILEALTDHLLPAVEALRRHRDYCRAHPPRRIEKQDLLPP